MHKKNLTKNEKELILNFFEKNKNCDSSPKHKIYNTIKSPRSKNRQGKNNKSKFKKKDKPRESKKIEKDKKESEGFNNIILYEFIDNQSKISWLKNFFYCLEAE